MKTVIIKNGTYGHRPTSDGRVIPISIGETCSVPDEEAERLVSLGVADVIDDSAVVDVATTGNAANDADAGKHTTDDDNGTDGRTDDDNDHQEDGVEIPDCLTIVDKHITKASAMRMKREDLDRLATDLGIDISGCEKKEDVADLIVAVELEIEEDDDNAPPVLNPAPPEE